MLAMVRPCRMPIDLRAKSSYELVVVTPVEAEPCLLNLLHMDIEVALEGPLAQRQHVHEVADLKNELSAQKGQSSSEAPARRRRKPSPYYSGATAIERVLSCCNPRSPSAGRSSAACSLARTARRPQRSWRRRRCRGVRALRSADEMRVLPQSSTGRACSARRSGPTARKSMKNIGCAGGASTDCPARAPTETSIVVVCRPHSGTYPRTRPRPCTTVERDPRRTGQTAVRRHGA